MNIRNILFIHVNKNIMTTILLVLLYIIAVSLLRYLGVLSGENLVLTFTATLGWLVALSIAIIHLERARRDNQAAKEYEIKKRLEIEAFKEVNKAINEFSSELTSVSILFFYSLPTSLEQHIKNPMLFKFDIMQVDQKIWTTRVNLYKGNPKFLLAIEANEIAIIEYDHYRKYINFKTADLYKLVDDFIEYFTKVNIDDLKKAQGFSEFKAKCHQIDELIHDIIFYLSDYRVLLMNSLLEEIFDKKVPPRKIKDAKYKLLTEVAIKEEVEKEEERRIKAAMKKSNK